MNSEQITAFKAGSASTPDEVKLLFLGLLCAALFLWGSWVCLTSYRAYAEGHLSLKGLGGIVARTVLLLLITFWLVLS